jgi:GT2 family glycosyltransferase
MNNTNLSVVIATIGNPCLLNTINLINSGTIIPDEILICIPRKFNNLNLIYLGWENIYIIETECIGQVQQRIQGFIKAKFDYVIQIDDDIIIEKNCFENLITCMKKLDCNTAVGPTFYELNDLNNAIPLINNKYYESLITPSTKFRRLYNHFLHGKSFFEGGEITNTGFNIPINPKSNNNLISTEWLAGGCILHLRKNLFLTNYYPFQGKAYCEDILHSYYLKKCGVNFYITTKASCCIKIDNIKMNNIQKYYYILNEFKARFLCVKLYKKSMIKTLIWYFIHYVSILSISIINKLKFA